MNTTGSSTDISSALPSHSLETRPYALRFVWGTVACAFAVLLLSAAGIRGAEIKQMTDIGSVSGYTRSENGITLQCAGNSQVRISVLAPDLIRVRASFGKSIPSQDHSWAIARIVWEPVQWTVTENPEQILIATSEVVVVVRRSPLLIEFQDAISHRVINSDELPMRFDPVGTGIAATKKLGADEHFYGLGEKAAPLNKRRQKFTMWNTDNAFYVEGTDPIYQSIPFYIGLEAGRLTEFFSTIAIGLTLILARIPSFMLLSRQTAGR